MPIILSLLTMLLYLGFYINDRVILEEAVKEAAMYAAATCPAGKDEMVLTAMKKGSEIISGKLFCVNNVKLNSEIKGDYVVVSASGSFVVPIFPTMAEQIFGNVFHLNAVGKGVITAPVNKIWLIEIAKSLGGEDD